MAFKITTLTDIKSAPKTYIELKNRIEEFFEENKPSNNNVISPRLFRIYIGVSKQTLSNWKTNIKRKEWFDLIKTCEDVLLGFIEQRTLDLSLTDKDTRVNILGLFNTLRAYDSEQYIPEQKLLTNKEEHQAPIIITPVNTSKLSLENLQQIKKEQ